MDLHQRTGLEMIVGLHDASACDPGRVGTKAATLASLLQAGFAVPHGVVLTTAAYLTLVDHSGPRPVDAAVLTVPLPETVQRALRQVLAAMGDVPLAVRSSASAEDLPDASFAGQYDTTLGVRGSAALERAVRRCWASLHSAHAAGYRTRTGADNAAMAVLIQRMVDARAAGVAFSAHPVTGARDAVVVNAVAGRGDRLVSGEVTPDEWVVTGDQVTLQSGPGAAITTDQVTRIAQLARRVASFLGGPQDIEWALGDGSVSLLQARPITALPEPPTVQIPMEVEVPPGRWERDASHFPYAAYPIDALVASLTERAVGTWVAAFGYLFDGLEVRDIGGWTYTRLRPLGGKEGPDLPTWVMWVLVRVVPPLRRRVAVATDAVRTDKPGRFIARWRDVWQPELSQAITRLHAVDLASLTDAELQRHVDAVHDLAGRGLEIHALVHGALAPILYEFVTTCEEHLGWDTGESLKMVSGTSFKSTEPARRLHELADMARHRPAVLELIRNPRSDIVARLDATDAEFAGAFARYMRHYGVQALGALADPTIAEKPTFVLDMIANQIAQGYDPGQADEHNAAIREETIGRARDALADQPAALAAFERVLRRAQAAYPAREDNEFYTAGAPLALLRYAILEVGRRLADRGVIDHRDDVMYLDLHDARAALSDGRDRRALVRRRKGERAWAQAHPGPAAYGKDSPPPSSLAFLPRDARLPMESMLWSLESMLAIDASRAGQSPDAPIRGTAVSPGSYTGPVRVVMDETEFDKLRAGDVLVCPTTSPVWTVLFPTIGALVTDTGGILSHPAIIAREYRVPAVVATGNATVLLEDDQIVTVDGATGTVAV